MAEIQHQIENQGFSRRFGADEWVWRRDGRTTAHLGEHMKDILREGG